MAAVTQLVARLGEVVCARKDQHRAWSSKDEIVMLHALLQNVNVPKEWRDVVLGNVRTATHPTNADFCGDEVLDADCDAICDAHAAADGTQELHMAPEAGLGGMDSDREEFGARVTRAAASAAGAVDISAVVVDLPPYAATHVSVTARLSAQRIRGIIPLRRWPSVRLTRNQGAKRAVDITT